MTEETGFSEPETPAAEPVPVAEQRAAGVPPEETVTVAEQRAGTPPPDAVAPPEQPPAEEAAAAAEPAEAEPAAAAPDEEKAEPADASDEASEAPAPNIPAGTPTWLNEVLTWFHERLKALGG